MSHRLVVAAENLRPVRHRLAKRVGAVRLGGGRLFSAQFWLFRSSWPFWLCFWSSQSRFGFGVGFQTFASRDASTVHSSAGLGGIPARSSDAALARRGTGSRATHVRASHPRPRAAATKSAAASSRAAARVERKHSRSVGEVLELARGSMAAKRLAVGFGRRRGVAVDDVAGFVRHAAGFHWCRRVRPRRTIRRGR